MVPAGWETLEPECGRDACSDAAAAGRIHGAEHFAEQRHEFAEFWLLEEHIGAPVYFAELHKPWQRGTNENTNGLLRFFFPKGCDFRAVSQECVDAIVALINSRPRKCLGWRSPVEFFFDESVALA